jgi:peptidyl-prolyl cis-trans isomerase SurA
MAYDNRFLRRLMTGLAMVSLVSLASIASVAHAQGGLRVPGGAGRALDPNPTTAPPRSPVVSDPKRIQLVDRIVAVVNKEVITKNELEARIRIVLGQLRQNSVEPPPADILERQVLERLVTDRAQQQFAAESGIKIDELALDRALTRVAEGNKLSLAEFRRRVEGDGIPFNRLREDIRTEMTLTRLREREVDAKVQVTESEVDNYLAEEKQNEGESSEYNLSHILVRVPEGASSGAVERLQTRAREALTALRSGTDFARVAVSYSDAPDGLQGGSMGWRARDRLPELFAEAVETLKPGGTTEVLRSPAGFHIVRLVERRGVKAGAAAVEQNRARHILVKTNELVSESEGRRKIALLRQRIVQGSDFAEIARLNSDDTSAAKGGELGWLFPGDTVPEFESAMRALKVDEVSEPVRSPFGWHLIQVNERRVGDVSSDRRRGEARKALRDRKSDEAFEDWVRQLRDRTYVEIRLEER